MKDGRKNKRDQRYKTFKMDARQLLLGIEGANASPEACSLPRTTFRCNFAIWSMTETNDEAKLRCFDQGWRSRERVSQPRPSSATHLKSILVLSRLVGYNSHGPEASLSEELTRPAAQRKRRWEGRLQHQLLTRHKLEKPCRR